MTQKKFSEENLRKIDKVIEIITNQIELEGWNRLLKLIKIPLKTLEKEGFYYEEAKGIIKAINQIDESELIKIINDEVSDFSKEDYLFDKLGGKFEERYRKEVKKERLKAWTTSKGVFLNISEKDLENYLILQIEEPEKLKKILQTNRGKEDKKWIFELKTEKERLKTITVPTDHRLIRDKWLAVKRILDIIYKQLSPLEDEEEIIEQTINIDVNSLSPIQKKFLPFVLKHSFNAGAISFTPDKSNIVITAEPAEKFLSGQGIVIENRNAFEDYRQKISELYHFIEEDGMARFPEVYSLSTTTQPTESIIQKEIKKEIKEVKKIKDGALQFPTPKNTRWEDITIKFRNDYDVDVIIGKNTYPSNYEKMEFADKRIKKKDEKAKANDSWELLRLFSTQKGTFPLNKLTGEEKEKRKKQKQALSKTLKELFPTIENDPFYEYDDIEGVYKIKIKLIPIETFREDFRDKDIKDESEDKWGMKDYYKDITGNQ